MTCLDDSSVLAFARGDLPRGPRAQLEAHIDGCAACRQLIAAALAGSAATLTPVRSPRWEHSLSPGAVVAGRYCIAELLGRGGMGEVYRARDTLLNQAIALKCVAASDSDDPRALKRLRDEALLARRVTHPHVCRIFDVGLHDDIAPLLFVTMELLEGPTLGAQIRAAGRLSSADALRSARQLAAGLEAAHAAGVVHRDFKSDNVILQRAPQTRAVITDFGLARDLTRAQASSAHTLVGTPAYVAPEQIEGKPPSVATDVYAFGVVLFEMTTGRLPFRGETALAGMVKRLTEPVPAPRALVPDLDPRLERAILGCLERAPVQRLPSLAAVRSVLEAEPTNARFMVPFRARRTWIGAGSIALAALYGTTLARSPSRPGRTAVVSAETPAHTHAAKAARAAGSAGVARAHGEASDGASTNARPVSVAGTAREAREDTSAGQTTNARPAGAARSDGEARDGARPRRATHAQPVGTAREQTTNVARAAAGEPRQPARPLLVQAPQAEGASASQAAPPDAAVSTANTGPAQLVEGLVNPFLTARGE